jgi:sigma-B regulation protein RsbU (phosphoserine phosphatase)
MVVIGDVAGQGARAAALTGLARFTVRAVAQLTGDPVAAAAQVNRTLRDQPETSLCTLAMLLLRVDNGGRLAVEVLACGHPLPLLARAGAVSELGEPGQLTGAFDEARWRTATVPLVAGDAVVLYTDGVVDTAGAGGARFGDARLHAALRSPAADASALVRRIDGALRAFQSGLQSDDTAVVALRVGDAAALAGAVAAGRAPARSGTMSVRDA